MSAATVTVRFLRGTGLGEDGSAAPGEVRVLAAGLARMFIAQGRAVEVTAEPDPILTPPEAFEAQEVPIENRDPAPRGRRKRRP